MTSDGTPQDNRPPPGADEHVAVGGADDAAPRRRRRRATGGVRAPLDPGPLLPARSADDQDTGWGERGPDDDDDERLLREVPPHW